MSNGRRRRDRLPAARQFTRAALVQCDVVAGIRNNVGVLPANVLLADVLVEVLHRVSAALHWIALKFEGRVLYLDAGELLSAPT